MGELAEIGLRHVGAEYVTATRIPELRVVHSPQARAGRIPTLQYPALCFIAQGAKQVTCGGKVYHFGEGEYLVAAVDLPMVGEILEASPNKPYVCFAVAIEPATVYQVARDLPDRHVTPGRAAITVGRDNASLADAVLRLARCLDNDGDAAILSRGIVREIMYRLLQSPFGPVVRDVGVAGGRTERLARAIAHIKTAFHEPMEVDELARLAGMSASSFHEHFKKVTTLSPLQYQKQLRLQEARRLLLLGGVGAAEVGFRVGYQSASQFSREYSRFFGHAPSAELHQGDRATA